MYCVRDRGPRSRQYDNNIIIHFFVIVPAHVHYDKKLYGTDNIVIKNPDFSGTLSTAIKNNNTIRESG